MAHKVRSNPVATRTNPYDPFPNVYHAPCMALRRSRLPLPDSLVVDLALFLTDIAQMTCYRAATQEPVR